MRLAKQEPVKVLDLRVGMRLKLDPDQRRWWRVQAVSKHFVACVQQADFLPRGTLRYTVLDWRNGVRGPCNLIGQGWGDGTYTEAECAEMLEAFENEDRAREEANAYIKAGHTTWSAPTYDHVEISHRNRVPLRVLEVLDD